VKVEIRPFRASSADVRQLPRDTNDVLPPAMRADYREVTHSVGLGRMEEQSDPVKGGASTELSMLLGLKQAVGRAGTRNG
jgi:hypothetical protein